nr:RNase H family protein [Halioglobus japonicus]
MYVKNGITQWLDAAGKRKAGRPPGKKPVKNIDLWQALDEQNQRHPRFDWRWVKGHSGPPAKTNRQIKLANSRHRLSW